MRNIEDDEAIHIATMSTTDMQYSYNGPLLSSQTIITQTAVLVIHGYLFDVLYMSMRQLQPVIKYSHLNGNPKLCHINQHK